MADLEGTVNFSGGDLTGELGVVVIGGGGEKPFIIPITKSTGGSGNVVYSTTVMFADIVDAYKTGKRILIRSRSFGGENDVEIVSATVTEISMNSTGGPITTSIDKIAMIGELMPQRNMSTLDRSLSADIYEFSYGANGATVTRNPMVVPTYDALSHVGMIIQSTTLDTMQKVIDVYGGAEWQKIEGRFLLGASSTHAAGSTGGSEDATLPAHTHEVTNNDISTSFHADGPDVDYSFTSDTINYSSGSESKNVLTGANVQMTNYGQGHSHTVPGTGTAGMVVDWEEPTFVNIGETGSSPVGANMPPYKTVYIWERTA